MKPEFSGIERCLEKLSAGLKKLEPFKKKNRDEILQDPYLQDIVDWISTGMRCCEFESPK
jgi:hypothetical protein